MKLLVTGALGFLGGSVARHAQRLGHEVLGTARGGGDAPFPLTAAGDESALRALVESFAPDVILHAAGTASVGASLTDPHGDFQSSVLPWAALLEAVRRSDRRPVLILPSSAAVYGNPAHLPVAEEATLSPISPYGHHKRICEQLAEEYASCFHLDIVVARLFSVFGSAQRRLLVWELYAQLAGAGERAEVQGTGQETRDFLHVDDVAEALLRLAAHRRGHTVVNVASGEEVRVLDLAHRLRDLVAPEKHVICRGIERPGDPKRWRADVTKLGALAAPWKARPMAEMLAACVEAWKRER